MRVYVNKAQYAEHIALIKGDVASGDDPVLVRMHALNVLDDVLGDAMGGHSGQLQAAMAEIGKAGRGVVVLIREPRPNALSDRLLGALESKPEGDDSKELRDYGVGAQILLDLGVKRLELLSNANRTVIGLEGYGIEIVGRRPIPTGGAA